MNFYIILNFILFIAEYPDVCTATKPTTVANYIVKNHIE